MSIILYSVVSKGTTILANHASCFANFEEVTEPIIANILPQNDRLTYSHGDYFFHYICENEIIYLCVTGKEFERSRAFLFLNEIKGRIQADYGLNEILSIDTKFSRVLANKMKYYSESQDVDLMSKLHSEMNDLNNILVKAVEKAMIRGTHIDDLLKKTDVMSREGSTFVTRTKALARSIYLKKIKLYIIMGVVMTVIAYFIVSMACGGLTWKGCIPK